MIGQITYLSDPDLDEWGFDTFWSCENWIQWYEALKDHYTKAEARIKWVNGWNEGDSLGHETICLFDPYFANYFKNQGIEIDNTFTAIVVGLQTITETSIDAGVNIAKFLKAIAPLAVIGVGLYFAAPFVIKLLATKKLM
jgi:hypothetical protein